MTPTPDAIAILATLDTKAEEARFLGQELTAQGQSVWYVDLGLTGSSPGWADTDRVQVLARTGVPSLDGMDKPTALAAVVSGAGAVLSELAGSGRLAGVIGLGGGQGTWLVTQLMKQLPLGLPKALITTLATRAGSYLGTADVTVFPSITDIAGLNPILRGVLSRAAGAMAGMVETHRRLDPGTQPMTALTMFGVTTVGGTRVRSRLREGGCEVAVFHANGSGGSVMEQLIRDGRVAGIVDWTTTELADELVGGIATAGPDRMAAAGRRGLPQVVVPGALDIVNFGPIESVPRRFRGRRLHQHTQAATLMRTDMKESERLGGLMAERLNESEGPVVVVVPAHGFSALSAPGGEFHDADADAAWLRSIEAGLDGRHSIVVLPFHINEAPFADAVAETYLSLTAPAHR